MEQLEAKINGLQQKLQMLVKSHQHLKHLGEKQQKEIDQLSTTNKQQAQMIEDLRQQNLVLKASITSLEPGDKRDLERKLNAYIKNIDQCITLLS